MLTKLAAGGASAPKLYSSDVFSAYLYTGNGATQTITNGIDLAGKGGMVWLKRRNGADSHHLFNTSNAQPYYWLSSDQTIAQQTADTNTVTALGSTGFSLGAYSAINATANTYIAWTFRKAPKFFDVQTATLASGNATVSFTDLATLGMVIVKRTDSTGSWYVWHRSLTAGNLLYLEQTAAEATLGHITVSGTTLTLVDGVLADGNYVCYGFAHDTSADGLIQCGSFSTDGSGNATVNLGWEPQFVNFKRSDSTNNWITIDSMRGFNHDAVSVGDALLMPNLSDAETTANRLNPLATGFYATNLVASATYIYLAIRRPNKPPTSGTQVYNAIARTGTGAAATVTGVGFAPDLVATHPRDTGYYPYWFDRLRGAGAGIASSETIAEATAAGGGITSFGVDGVGIGSQQPNTSGENYINWFFRRAPGVFDQVCYTGTGVAKTEAHNLGVVPELMIVKRRSGARNWCVYNKTISATSFLVLNLDQQSYSDAGNWNDTEPTASVFTLGADFNANGNGSTYVAYLFATLAGISKVGSYTGNGSNQTINCGFTTGARFILIKRTDSTGDWFVWDSVRGIIAGNDPHLSLNTTAAEVTTDDSIDPDTSGFIVNQVAATDINVNAATYIFLSLA